MKRAIVCGNVGDTKVFQTKNENYVAKIQVATNQVYRTKEKKRVEEVTWHEIAIFNQSMVEFVKNNIQKGMLIYAEGTMHHYKSPKDEAKYMNILCNHPSNLRILSGEREIEEQIEEQITEEQVVEQ